MEGIRQRLEHGIVGFMPWQVTNVTRDRVLATRAVRAEGFWDRFRGLMMRRELPMGEGLHLVPCDSIHTFFMRIPIDVLFLDAEGRVLRLYEALPPWRTTLPSRACKSVLELPIGTLRGSGTEVGDLLAFEPPAG